MSNIGAEVAWLVANPDFQERPATLEEFLGPVYLNVEGMIRERILKELQEIMGHEVGTLRPTVYQLALITGGIGIGKTTIASIVLPYLAHWLLCLKDPQRFFDLLPGSRIALMMMSTSESQAREVLFGDVKARIQFSEWFKKYPFDANYKNQIRFTQKEIWIVPGDSAETTFEGYNIFGGILDEADSHKVTQSKDYADSGYDAISSRITSRFQDRGFFMVIGQMKSSTGFVARKMEEFDTLPEAYVVKLPIWESMGDEFYVKRDPNNELRKFAYDTKRKQIIPSGAAELIDSDHILWIPELYRRQFTTNPEKALRDLAGMPGAVGDPFISLEYKIFEARDRWIANHGKVSPVTPEGRFEPWFGAPDTLKRTLHLDLAYSAEGDALGMAMGHVSRLIEVDDELKPYITIDMLLRIKARPGGEIFLGDVRKIIYALREKFRYRLELVTMDGFQSVDTNQQLKRKRFKVDDLSIDKEVGPYHDLREAIYEDRIEFPPYLVDLEKNGTRHRIEILPKELSELVDTGRKIDHPMHGSKDVADGVAGCTFTLMGDRAFRKKQRQMDVSGQRRITQQRRGGPQGHPAYRGDFSPSAPLPPRTRRI